MTPPRPVEHRSERPTALEAVGLTIEYETQAAPVRAVDNVNFVVRRGERFVLLGPSGCGKSSILKAVAGFIQPAAGIVRVGGRPVSGPGPDRVLVFQEFDQLFPWKTVLGNVAFALRTARRFSRKRAVEQAAEYLAKVGLANALHAYPHTLSGGMKQRVAIARALASQADVLLMDEPFASLDALTRRGMQDHLLALAGEFGFTLLFVTHSIDEAVLIGERLLLLNQAGQSIGTYDASEFGGERGGANQLRAASSEIHRLLFGAKPEALNA